MENKKKIVRIIGALAIFILTLVSFFFAGNDLISLVKMDDKITFSSSVFIVFCSFPLISYAIFFIVFVNVTGYYPKYHDGFVKYLGSIWVFLFFFSFPTSLYVNYKLRSDNYLVCPRISWMSPNTYVKDIKLCD
ncbi:MULTISPECIES: DUF1240 domain-containing protein [Photorhabdus]|uniref:Uncharacterized protein DUF1240 n=2 Tax=Photorhabdus asymbiotica TaxID=291112 RepID=A0ABX9SKP3_9GAMM|nr:DUF1240 domain-containing protein [Photorhabdus asymbiotica]RKS54431.1 uncharacterized protein DUF1240 [Photorhabdus asymbiotica]CAQ82413.1 similar to putative membrane protein [Photorhabdus asymbiotica]CAR67301.1 similar to putative membrane protein [Photorhabdus asymbiotica subsp. asymbiotica ATCC 43949]